jgi:hypothetical protein
MWCDRDLSRSRFLILPRRMTLPFIVQRVTHYRGNKGRKSEVERKSVPSFAGRGCQLRQSGPPALLVGASEDHRPSPASWGGRLILSPCIMLRRSG